MSSKVKAPLKELQDYLPEGSFDPVLSYIVQYSIQLTITRKRKTILGNYQYDPKTKKHYISVNGNLNKYSFLITLLHEIAHLVSFEKYGGKIQPHGLEWKKEFGIILKPFCAENLFPSDLQIALQRTLHNAAAGTCGDPQLLRTLKKYDPIKEGFVTVEELVIGTHFCTEDNRVFILGQKQRTRYKCQELATGRWYLFNGLYEVKHADKSL